nr:hypothetical protein [Tanacetum cinerariifolium]GEY43186.1 hypothetical protein [Tanacetum cinerariifolium]
QAELVWHGLKRLVLYNTSKFTQRSGIPLGVLLHSPCAEVRINPRQGSHGPIDRFFCISAYPSQGCEVVAWAVAGGESGGGAMGRWQWCCMSVAAGCNGDDDYGDMEMVGCEVVAWAVAGGESGGGAMGRWQWCCMSVAAGCNGDDDYGDMEMVVCGVERVPVVGCRRRKVVRGMVAAAMVVPAIGIRGIISGFVGKRFPTVVVVMVGGRWPEVVVVASRRWPAAGREE